MLQPRENRLAGGLAAVAQFERELIRERVSAGMKAAKMRGTKTGNAVGRARRIFESLRGCASSENGPFDSRRSPAK